MKVSLLSGLILLDVSVFHPMTDESQSPSLYILLLSNFPYSKETPHCFYRF